MTVDEILAMGEYTDRRFRLWELSRNTRTGEDRWMVWEPFLRRTELTPAQMRLLIERDQHRDECPGFGKCASHPVPLVMVFEGSFGVQSAGPLDVDDLRRPTLEDLPGAMDAARALAVGE